MTDHWWDEAKCYGRDQEFEAIGKRRTEMRTKDREVAAICIGCPVLRECALDALGYKDLDGGRAGIWLRPKTRWSWTSLHPFVQQHLEAVARGARLEAIVYGLEAISA